MAPNLLRFFFDFLKERNRFIATRLMIDIRVVRVAARAFGTVSSVIVILG